MALQERELIERQTADLVRLRGELAKALQSNARLAAERLKLCAMLVDRECEIERLDTRALRVALSSAPPPADEPEDDDNYDGPDAPDYDAPTAQERYQAAHAESVALSRGR